MGNSPPPTFWGVIQEICGEAIKHNIRIWIDAEQQIFQSTIDTWTTSLMRTYNHDGQAHIYTTFQAYLKSTPARISQHLALASAENWVLGIKLVRGAYIASEPRYLIHDTKAETDAAYNSIVHVLLNQCDPASGLRTLAKIQLFLASHNEESVRKAYALQRARVLAGEPVIKLEFGQLQGMSDEVSCRLLRLCQEESEEELRPKAFKCLNWGSTQECMQFLIRRAIENRGAMERTRVWADGLRMELWRRVKLSQKYL
jgi:proline dehydrogenase